MNKTQQIELMRLVTTTFDNNLGLAYDLMNDDVAIVMSDMYVDIANCSTRARNALIDSISTVLGFKIPLTPQSLAKYIMGGIITDVLTNWYKKTSASINPICFFSATRATSKYRNKVILAANGENYNL